MRKVGTVLLAFAVAFSAYPCWGDGDEVTAARIDVIKKVVGFAAGWQCGLLFHEAGHAVAARLENVGMDWSDMSDPRWTAQTDNKSKLRVIAAAGYGAEVFSSEVILGANVIPKDNAFILGWLAFDILNPLIYTLRDSLEKGGYGDMETLRNSGVNTDIVKVALLAHAALSAYRLYENPKFIPYVSATQSKIVLGLSWRW
jgi:hypothetical protein